MEVMTMVESGPVEAARRPWSPLARVAFRFCFVYFGLYCLISQIMFSVFIIPGIDGPDPASLPPLRAVVFWVGSHVFRLSTSLVYSGSGSGDKYFDYVEVFCVLVFSILCTATWSALDRKRADYATLYRWYWHFLRLSLGGQMLSYGIIKVVPLQMPYPYLARLVEQFGDFSPMGVLWASVGASPAYERFAGGAELAAAVLLMFPRTVTLGALVCLGDLIEIFILNMTYDVPVKQYSFHLILITLLVLAPDYRRLAMFFFLNRPTEAPQRIPLFASRRANRIAGACIAFLWIWMIGNNLYGAWDRWWHQEGPGASRSPLYGIWNIQDYSVDGKPQPLLITDAHLWRRLVFDFPQYAEVQLMEGSRGYAVAVDAAAGTVTFTDRADKNRQAHFTYTRPVFDRLVLDGTMEGHPVILRLQRVDEKKFLLASRGFHWIQDYPFNR